MMGFVLTSVLCTRSPECQCECRNSATSPKSRYSSAVMRTTEMGQDWRSQADECRAKVPRAFKKIALSLLLVRSCSRAKSYFNDRERSENTSKDSMFAGTTLTRFRRHILMDSRRGKASDSRVICLLARKLSPGWNASFSIRDAK